MAETTLEAALSLGADADHAEIVARAHEIRAWMQPHRRRLPRAIASARAGIEAVPRHAVGVQLAAQEAKA